MHFNHGGFNRGGGRGRRRRGFGGIRGGFIVPVAFPFPFVFFI